MNDLDRKIREALSANEAEWLGEFEESSLSEQVLETFRGSNSWLVVGSWIMITAFFILAVVSVISFFQAESVREMLAWAGGFGWALISMGMGKIWYWMELNRNAVLREIKRVELQLARLASRLKPSE